jgi:hypothetical protein
MCFLLLRKFLPDAAELLLDALDLISHGFALLAIHLHGRPTGKPPVCAVDDRGDDFQIA